MATKLKFNVLGDLELNPVILQAVDGAYEAPTSYQLPHRFYYDTSTNSIKDKYENKTDREVQEIDHAAATVLALELGTTPPPPLPAAV